MHRKPATSEVLPCRVADERGNAAAGWGPALTARVGRSPPPKGGVLGVSGTKAHISQDTVAFELQDCPDP